MLGRPHHLMILLWKKVVFGKCVSESLKEQKPEPLFSWNSTCCLNSILLGGSSKDVQPFPQKTCFSLQQKLISHIFISHYLNNVFYMDHKIIYTVFNFLDLPKTALFWMEEILLLESKGLMLWTFTFVINDFGFLTVTDVLVQERAVTQRENNSWNDLVI